MEFDSTVIVMACRGSVYWSPYSFLSYITATQLEKVLRLTVLKLESSFSDGSLIEEDVVLMEDGVDARERVLTQSSVSHFVSWWVWLRCPSINFCSKYGSHRLKAQGRSLLPKHYRDAFSMQLELLDSYFSTFQIFYHHYWLPVLLNVHCKLFKRW